MFRCLGCLGFWGFLGFFFCFFFRATDKEQSVTHRQKLHEFSPAHQDLENSATHRVTLVCRRQRPLPHATPTTTWRTPSPLCRTRSLATLSTMPAVPVDAGCGARGGPPTGSRRPKSRGTSVRRLPQQGAQPAPGTFVLSSSWRPPLRRRCQPSQGVPTRRSAKWRPWSCRSQAVRRQTMAVSDDLQPMSICRIWCRQVHISDHHV